MPGGRASGIIQAAMSGIFVIDVVFIEAAFLANALLQLGCTIREDARQMRAAGCMNSVEFTATHPKAAGIEIGFKKLDDGSLTPIADWDKLADLGVDKKEFLDELTQKYSYLKTVDEAQKQGYTIVEEKNEVDGSIKVILRKFG